MIQFFQEIKWRPVTTMKTGRNRKAKRVGTNNSIDMKKNIISFGLIVCSTLGAYAQEFYETNQALSSKAVKGYMYDVKVDDTGNSLITYKMSGAKKSDQVFYEEYSFDKDLKFIGNKDIQESKAVKSDYVSTSFGAYVGGVTSFDVLNMKLKLRKIVANKTWNYEKQRYVVNKYISNETIKPKNDNGKVYLGYASYGSADDQKSDLFILAKIDSKKNEDSNFYVLLFNGDSELTEKSIELKGNYSLVFCEQDPNEDVVMVFAPNKGSSDLTKYVYFQYDILGNLKNRVEFKSPASALIITGMYENEGNVYFCGSSVKSTEAFQDVFNEYAPIYNPGNTPGGANIKDIKWQKSTGEKMDNFHFLKFTGNQMTFASTTPVAEFKNKFKTAPGDKGASTYKGSKFYIDEFTVTPSGDYLIAGQLTSTVALGTDGTSKSFEDIICFHFDKAGALKAQYGIGKINTDKKSEIFSMPQHFYLSADGKKMYWEIMEVKGVKGYESFVEAYYGVPSYYALLFPRVGSIDLDSATLGAFKTMGENEYYFSDYFRKYDASEKSITYYGHDESGKKLWIGKVLTQ
jgi:hypothetical protein